MRATTALVHIGLKAFPGEVTAKGYSSRNPWGRSEYMTLDVAITDPNSWTAPLFIAEHENSPSFPLEAVSFTLGDAQHRTPRCTS